MTQQPHDAYADLAPSVGDRLRIARERRAKLSQGDFADLINVARDRSGPRPAGAGRGPKCGELARPEVFETPTF